MIWAADQRIREISYIHSTDDENEEEEDYADSEVCDGDIIMMLMVLLLAMKGGCSNMKIDTSFDEWTLHYAE